MSKSTSIVTVQKNDIYALVLKMIEFKFVSTKMQKV